MDIKSAFESVGGIFLCEEDELKRKLGSIRAFVLDWDGVFNEGRKESDHGSTFSEPDSMGLNMLRFSHWLNNRELPKTAIISGAANETAITFAKREHFDYVMINSKNKIDAFHLFCDKNGVNYNEVLFVFDDILDLRLAELCGVSICVKRGASPLFTNHVQQRQLAAYITGHSGGQHAIREVCEMIVGLIGQYTLCIDERVAFTDTYREYWDLRQKTDTIIG
ncbi:MAG: hypothetical protein R2813_11500 [Flavobacteriales bacterium]